MGHDHSLDIAALRERLADRTGPDYWRSLQEIAETEAFQDALNHEFAEGADQWDDSISRRHFLQVMGASMAFAGVGLSGCDWQPDERILPYVDQPEQVIPGEPLFFATSFLLAGYAQGVLVESHMGRPTKIEGNPDHPASRGSTNAFMQASVLDLYDPDRSQNVLFQGAISTWTSFVEAMQTQRQRWQAEQGRGLRVLTETVTSPTLAAQLRTLLGAFPEAQWHQYDPTAHGGEREGIRRARGAYRQAVYRFDRADVVLSLDDDFLLRRPGSVRYARDFSDRRRVREDDTAMNRLYVAESSSTITGAMADHRLPARPHQIEALARTVAQQLGIEAGATDDLPNEQAAWAKALARDLQENAGAALVVAGPTLSLDVQELVHRMNEALDGVGATVEYTEPVEARVEDHQASLRQLVDDMAAGAVETLVILGGNPAYTAPGDVPFARHLPDVPTSVHLSRFVDETSRACIWHVPRTHYLEQWGDALAFDGTASILQPLIAPLYEPARTSYDLLAVLNGTSDEASRDRVRGYWEDQYTGTAFDAFWEQALQRGVVPGTGLSAGEAPDTVRVGGVPIDDLAIGRPTETLRPEEELVPDDTTGVLPEDTTRTAIPPLSNDTPPAKDDGTVDIIFRPDPTIWDGRFANNGWLQELPKPLTKLVWDNAALVSPGTAERYDLQSEDVVELRHEERSVRAPVWILPGHPDGTVTVSLGYGRDGAGRVGDGAGFNAYALRSSQSPWVLQGATLQKTEDTYPLVSTQQHFSMEGRELVRAAPITLFRKRPDVVHDGHPRELPTLYPEWEYEGYKWGMSIDANTCIGCNACVVACQAENNIPVVGKEQVDVGRQMHWLLVDRYYQGDIDNPETYFQPRPCMHCEKAPCEVVCPVYATVHDHEGLNVMIYNRCIGTRYCSNNCPYKVRRFNFLEWNDWNDDLSAMQHNPDVTVRSRGVMEKCTYCQQRINQARIRAKREDRDIRDGEVMTACQQACPTHAIVFGDLNDATEVNRLQEQPHNYGLLAELGTQPRTTYLAHFNNPNPALPERRGGRALEEDEEAPPV